MNIIYFLYLNIYNFKTYDFTNSIEHNPSSEANSRLSVYEIPRLLRNPKIHYRFRKNTLPRFWVTLIQFTLIYQLFQIQFNPSSCPLSHVYLPGSLYL